ncbi:unnamed protein product, partial [Allacma fusca]
MHSMNVENNNLLSHNQQSHIETKANCDFESEIVISGMSGRFPK